MYRDRVDAALRLAAVLQERPLRSPLVLAIPRGGLVLGAVLAQKLNAELDVVLSRKLRAPNNPEVAIGAVAETGQVTLNCYGEENHKEWEKHIAQETEDQLQLIAHRKRFFREVRPHACVHGRSVIVTDDGIATGSTMLAALQVIRSQEPYEVLVAVPVAAPDRLKEVGAYCDEVVCPHAPEHFWAIGSFYLDFRQVSDEEVLLLLSENYSRCSKLPS
jgi:putative phosphoribosyl transferase